MAGPSMIVRTPQTQNDTPLAYRAVQGSMWAALGSYWHLAFGFGANILLMRLLLPSAFGTFALASFFTSLCAVRSLINPDQAFVRQKEVSGDTLGTYCVLSIGASFAGLLLVVILAPVFHRAGYDSLVMEVAVVLSVGGLLGSLTGIMGTVVEQGLYIREMSIMRAVFFPLSYVPGFWLAVHDGGVWSIVVQNITFNLLQGGGSLWLARRKIGFIWSEKWRFNPLLARRFLRFGSVVGIAAVTSTFLTQIDNFFIGTFVGVAALGLYDRAYRVAEWPDLVFAGINGRIAYYIYARLQDDRVRLEKALSMIFWGIGQTAFPVAMAVFVVAPDLILFLYGEKWGGAVIFVRLLVVYSLFRPLWNGAGAYFTATGKPGKMITWNTVQVGVLVAAGLPFTVMWGAIGTCIAVILANTTGTVLVCRSLSREASLKLGSILLVPALACIPALVFFCSAEHYGYMATLPVFLRILIKSAATVTSFYFFVVLVRPKETKERVVYIRRLFLGKEEGETS